MLRLSFVHTHPHMEITKVKFHTAYEPCILTITRRRCVSHVAHGAGSRLRRLSGTQHVLWHPAVVRAVALGCVYERHLSRHQLLRGGVCQGDTRRTTCHTTRHIGITNYRFFWCVFCRITQNNYGQVCTIRSKTALWRGHGIQVLFWRWNS